MCLSHTHTLSGFVRTDSSWRIQPNSLELLKSEQTCQILIQYDPNHFWIYIQFTNVTSRCNEWWKSERLQAHHMHNCVNYYSNASDESHLLYIDYAEHVDLISSLLNVSVDNHSQRSDFKTRSNLCTVNIPHIHSIICELPSLLFFYFLLNFEKS